MISRIDVTDALLETLRSATGKAIGDHAAPANAPGSEFPTMPYGVLFSLSGGDADGPPFGAMFSEASVVYQVTCVGETRSQCEWMSDKVRAAVLGRGAAGFTNAITVTGAKVINRDLAFAGGVTQEGALFNSVEQYVLELTST